MLLFLERVPRGTPIGCTWVRVAAFAKRCSLMRPDQPKHDRAHRERMRAAGFASVRVWVPQAMRDRLIRYAARLRKEYGAGKDRAAKLSREVSRIKRPAGVRGRE